MPRAPAFKIDAIADLLRQIEYAPSETRKRQMDAAERLAGEVDPNLAYPSEFVTFRITGYRPESGDLLTFNGAALRPDLVNFVQRLSGTLDLPPRRDQHVALTVEEVAQRLSVSAKTIQRYRREGLVCHVVAFDSERRLLACYADALERFAAARQDHLRKAAGFTRISRDTEALIIDEAKRLRAERPISLSAAARIIARNLGRAHETIRQMLRRHDRRAARPLFTERGPLNDREIAIMHRAWSRGVDLGTLAERFGRSRPAIHRAISGRRAEILRRWKIAFIHMPTFALQGAADVILSAPAACNDLLALPPHHDALQLIEWAGAAEPPLEDIEDALLGAWNYLKMRAVSGIARLALDEALTSEQVDAIETDLRWATRLHRRLTLLAFPAALRRIESNLGRSLRLQPAEHIVSLIVLARGVIREALEGVDPSRDQRLQRIVAFAMERALAQRSGGLASRGQASRASARHVTGAIIPLHGVFDAIDKWEPGLDPWRHWRPLLPALPDTSRTLITLRFGWDGFPPQTMIAMAKRLGMRSTALARRLQKAVRELRSVARQPADERK